MANVSFGRRAASYWFVDGLPDVFFGLALAVVTTLAFLWRTYAAWKKLDWVILCGGLALFFSRERIALDFLKSRITYPRTGYVRPPEESEGSRGARPITLGLRPDQAASENVTSFRMRTEGPIFFFLSLIWVSPPARWVSPALIPVMALTLYVANRKSEHSYNWWSVLILGLAGLVFPWDGAPVRLQALFAALLTAGWLTTYGLCTLIDYLRTNPRPEYPETARS